MRQWDKDFYKSAWRAAADAHGAALRYLRRNTFEITKNDQIICVTRNSTPLDNPAAVGRASDKLLSYRLMADAGIPVPYHILIEPRDFGLALRMLRLSSTALVVKPASDTGGGAGVSTNINTPGQLLSAVAWAASYSRKVLVEKQIEGECYRVLIIDQQVADVVARRPPSIIGDGSSTIARLLTDENRMRIGAGSQRAQVLIRVDHDLRNTLASQGLTLASRPALNQLVVLKHAVNDNNALENVPANDIVCPAIINTALRAAALIDTRFAGIDLICSDPASPLERSGGVVIEINAPPGFYYHYGPNATARFPVAQYVLNALLNSD